MDELDEQAENMGRQKTAGEDFFPLFSVYVGGLQFVYSFCLFL